MSALFSSRERWGSPGARAIFKIQDSFFMQPIGPPRKISKHIIKVHLFSAHGAIDESHQKIIMPGCGFPY